MEKLNPENKLCFSNLYLPGGADIRERKLPGVGRSCQKPPHTARTQFRRKPGDAASRVRQRGTLRVRGISSDCPAHRRDV